MSDTSIEALPIQVYESKWELQVDKETQVITIIAPDYGHPRSKWFARLSDDGYLMVRKDNWTEELIAWAVTNSETGIPQYIILRIRKHYLENGFKLARRMRGKGRYGHSTPQKYNNVVRK